MKRRLTIITLALLSLTGCPSKKQQPSTQTPVDTTSSTRATTVQRDLSEIKKDGILRVLVEYSSTSYFLYRGQPMGFEYELLERLAKHLDLKLDLVITKNINEQFEVLNRGEVDLIANGVTITTDRKEKVQFTDYLYLVKQVLVQKKPANWRKMKWSVLQKHLVHDPIELIGDTVSVRKNTSYYERLRNLSDEVGGRIVIDTLPGHLSANEIIDMVVDGKIRYTVVDDNLAKINASYYPVLDIKVPISFSQRIAWVVRKNSPELLAAINEWIQEERGETTYYVIYNKYFKNKRTFRRRVQSNYYSLNNKQISKYDDLIIRHAKKLGWDWRLLASQVYQESRFKPGATSWAGASGLMQVMPATARALGITNPADPQQSIRGGATYLRKLYRRFSDIRDSIDRIKFTMAAYNCGYEHVRDAQRLAEAEGLNQYVWHNNVDKMLLALSSPTHYNKPFVKYGYVRGREPVNYVKHIFERYDHYKKFIES